MPFLVGNLAILSLILGTLGIIVSVVPFGKFLDDKGRALSFWEFWSGGYALAILLFARPSFLFGVGSFRRWNWVRVIWPAFTLVSAISCWFAPEPNLAQSITITVIFILMSAYFWRSEKIRTYFSAKSIESYE